MHLEVQGEEINPLLNIQSTSFCSGPRLTAETFFWLLLYFEKCLWFEAFHKSSPELWGTINLRHLAPEWTLLGKPRVPMELLRVFVCISKSRGFGKLKARFILPPAR